MDNWVKQVGVGDQVAVAPGEMVMVVARLKSDADTGVLDRVTLETSGARIVSPPVRAAGLREVAWQVAAGDAAGTKTIVVSDGGAHLTKSLVCGRGLARVSACRVAGFWEWLRYPGERRLPQAQSFARLEIRYPEAEYNLLGWRTGWLPAVLILSFLAGLALKRPLRVEM